jgi:hypothetical protein
MKTLIIFSLSIIVVLTGCNSSRNIRNNMSQEELVTLAAAAVNNHNFVLEADYIIPRVGPSIFVSSNTNFIAIQGNKATIQLALNSQFSGPNGIGGITLDGNITNEKITTDKKGNIYYTSNVQGAVLSASISLTLPNGTDRCTATVTPNFSGNIITFSGHIVPTTMSNVYKGQAY